MGSTRAAEACGCTPVSLEVFDYAYVADFVLGNMAICPVAMALPSDVDS